MISFYFLIKKSDFLLAISIFISDNKLDQINKRFTGGLLA